MLATAWDSLRKSLHIFTTIYQLRRRLGLSLPSAVVFSRKQMDSVFPCLGAVTQPRWPPQMLATPGSGVREQIDGG
jgi:hypothetical protein